MEGNLTESPLLIAQNGPLKGQRWTINKPLLVGRETTCEIVVPDRMVSRFHARITPTPEGMVLEDLDSKNGTHCNGNPVDGQVIIAGWRHGADCPCTTIPVPDIRCDRPFE